MEKLEIAKELAREIYGKYISDVVAEKYAKNLITIQDGTPIELNEVENGENGLEYTLEVLQARLQELKAN